MYNIAPSTVTITVEIKNVRLGVDPPSPARLSSTNSYQTAQNTRFPTDARAKSIALQRANDAHTLTVADECVGFPVDFDFRATDSLGIQLAVTLVDQLEGTIRLDRENGTAFVISFSVD